MTGRVIFSREKGRTPPRVERLCGLSVMAVTIHAPEGLRRRVLEHRLERAERVLLGASVNRVIFPPDFPYGERFHRFRTVEPMELYRAVADVLTLGWLELHGIEPRYARVTLAGTRLSPELEYAARRLCSAVRGICIDVPGEEGAFFAARLQQTCGVPVTPRGTPSDLRVEFAPTGGGELRLWGERAWLDGLCLRAEGVEPPPELAECVLTLLWEQGKLPRHRLRVTRREKC